MSLDYRAIVYRNGANIYNMVFGLEPEKYIRSVKRRC